MYNLKKLYLASFNYYGGVTGFLKKYRSDPSLQTDPKVVELYQLILQNSSVCSFCGVGCPFTMVTTNDGTFKLTPTSGLGLCVKGETSLLTGGYKQREEILKRKGIKSDRITSPMIRDYNGNLVETSWEEALDRAAWLFLHVREWVGPDGVAVYGNGQMSLEALWMASLYKLVFNVSTLGSNSEHCLASAGSAHQLNFGNEASFSWKEYGELNRCDIIVIHGCNPLITFPQAYSKIKLNKSALKIVIDPIENDTFLDLKSKSERVIHIRFKQGADVLFNMGVARIILENRWENVEYIKSVVDLESFNEFKAICLNERFSLDSVAKKIVLKGEDITLLKGQIYEYAQLISKPDMHGIRPRPVFFSSMGINQSTGTYGFSSNLNLLLLTGNVGRRDAGYLRITGQSNASSTLSLGFNSRKLIFNLDPLNDSHRELVSDVLELPLSNIPSRIGTPVSRMADNDHLYCFLFIGTNFSKNMPGLGKWLTRISRSFNIVVDSFISEDTLGFVDVLLPALTFTERYGVIQRGDRTLQLQQPLTEAPEMAWPDEQILARLALSISKRLEDVDTAALNKIDPEVVSKTFAHYLNQHNHIDTSAVFDHMVETSKKLNVYNRLVNGEGQSISHAMIKDNAGDGVQWQGDGRYSDYNSSKIFPGIFLDEMCGAKLVIPPEQFFNNFESCDGEEFKSLITGRGRPGHKPESFIARYNSGIKTLPIYDFKNEKSYMVEIHPSTASSMSLKDEDLVRIVSRYGMVVARVHINSHVPREYHFLDFVAGEPNRLTNYLESDDISNQSFIKRTPVKIYALSTNEETLFKLPEKSDFLNSVNTLHNCFDEDYNARNFKRKGSSAHRVVTDFIKDVTSSLNEDQFAALGAMSAFFQRYRDDEFYRASTKLMLRRLSESERFDFLTILLPLLRKLQYQTLMIPILSDTVSSVPMLDKNGDDIDIDLLSAHRSSVLEIKEEVVGVQLFEAIKLGLRSLFGDESRIVQDDIAIISGIRIPCSSDMPFYFMGISPAALDSLRFVYCSRIGKNAVAVIDRKKNRVVKVDIVTGVLPLDKELHERKKSVIMLKQAGTHYEHRRFFERLAELIAGFVRSGRENFKVVGPFPIPWSEFVSKLSFVPAQRKAFKEFLIEANLSRSLVDALVSLEIIDADEESKFLEQLLNNSSKDSNVSVKSSSVNRFSLLINSDLFTIEEKVQKILKEYISPVLNSDGGRIEMTYFDVNSGEVGVRFLGSCSNCPSSMLSIATIVKPPLLNIPGVKVVRQRTYIKEREPVDVSPGIGV